MGDELTIIDYIPKRKNGNWLSDDFRAQEILQRFSYDITIGEGLNQKEKVVKFCGGWGLDKVGSFSLGFRYILPSIMEHFGLDYL